MKFPNISDEEQEVILQTFARKKRIVFISTFLPFSLLIGLIVTVNLFHIGIPSIIFWILFGIGCTGSALGWYYLRCPHCNHIQDHSTWDEEPSWWARTNGAILMVRQCVYCGVYLNRKAWEHELWLREWRKNHGHS